MTAPRVVVLDHGSGNLRSAVRALEHVGAATELTSDLDLARSAAGLVVPGVGAFAAVVSQLRALGAPDVIAWRLARSAPVLGICVGMQVMFERGLEHGIDTVGLGHVPGEVRRLSAPIVPHMGWSPVTAPSDTRLLAGLDGQMFYFVHSYAAPMPGPGTPGAFTAARHGEQFCAALEVGALSATQFHPEKSADAGAELLRNWLGTLR